MDERQPLSGLNRRDFLKVAAQISVTGLTMALLTEIPARMSHNVSPAPVQAEALGRRFRGTSDGRVFESLDGGRTWQEISPR